jgi:hypothetical protein
MSCTLLLRTIILLTIVLLVSLLLHVSLLLVVQHPKKVLMSLPRGRCALQVKM